MIWILAALALLLPSVGHAAVAFNNVSTTSIGSPGSLTTTHAHTVSGTDTAIYVAVTLDNPVAVSSITHAGQALSQIASCTTVTGDNFGRIEVWRRLSPASGTNNVVTTIASPTKFKVQAISFTGVSQSATATCVTPTTGVSNAPTITVTSTSGELTLAFLAVSIEGTEAATIGAGHTSRWNETFDGSIIAAGSTATGAASVPMPWTINDTDAWAMTGLRIQASGPPDTQAPTAPGTPVGSPITSSSITTTVAASIDNVAVVEYRYERASFSGTCGTFTEIAQPQTTTYTDTGLTQNTTYCVRWRAFDGTNLSAYSTTAQISTLAVRQATLNWTNNASYTNIVVSRCASQGCSDFNDIATISGSLTQYVDSTSPTPVAGYQVRGKLTGAPDSDGSNIVYTSASPTAILQVSPATLLYSATVGGANPANQTITIANNGPATMNWTVSDNASWLSCTPSSGTNNGSTTCSVNISGLTSGTHLATVTVTAAGAQGSPGAVSVSLSLSPQTQPGGTTPGTSFGGRVR